MEAYGMRLPKRNTGVGALVGLAVGAFAAVPWGTFSASGSPGLWLAAPLVLGFTLIGAWFGTVVSLSAVDQEASQHRAHAEGETPVFGGHHEHPTPA